MPPALGKNTLNVDISNTHWESDDKDYITHLFLRICQSKTKMETSERLEWEMKTQTHTEH